MTAMMATELEGGRGAYEAQRAAALAGVPVSTLHYWARHSIYTPLISPEPRVRYWSWMDLLALRMIDWLRSDASTDGKPRIPISRIRKALYQMEELGIGREKFHQLAVLTTGGELFLRFADSTVQAAPGRQQAWSELLQVVRPYKRGPDLLEPRPLLRIIPGKLHGEPHLVNTRITSATVYALHRAGYEIAAIREMYPEASTEAIEESVDLESALSSPAA